MMHLGYSEFHATEDQSLLGSGLRDSKPQNSKLRGFEKTQGATRNRAPVRSKRTMNIMTTLQYFIAITYLNTYYASSISFYDSIMDVWPAESNLAASHRQNVFFPN